MGELKFAFQNNTQSPRYIFLEISTARFRLDPGDEFFLLEEAGQKQDEHGSCLRMEFMVDGTTPQLVICTSADEMFRADGTKVECDFTSDSVVRSPQRAPMRWLRTLARARRR